MADITINVANIAPSANAVYDRTANFGATILQGEIVYKDTNGLWQKMDANASATGNGVTDVRGMAAVAGANGQPATVITQDSYLGMGPLLTNGASYWASPNAGNIAPVADVTSGNYATFLGVARSTSRLNFRPVASGIAV